MNAEQTHEIDAAFDSVTAVVGDRLSRNLRIRRNLPGGGRVRIDRQLPFLCVYRVPKSRRDPGTRELATTEAAYICASGEPEHEPGLIRLLHEIAAKAVEHFGAFLLIEFWADDNRFLDSSLPDDPPPNATRPSFHIVTAHDDALSPAVEALEESLHEVHSQGRPSDVQVHSEDAPAPPAIASLASALEVPGAHVIGLAIRPVYRDARTGATFPVVLRALRRQLAVALRKCVFAFTGQQPIEAFAHYESLGPSVLVKAARVVDQQLSEVSQSFDFVLQTVPINSSAAWEEFAAAKFSKAPTLYYRPLPYDPASLKRRLFEIPVDRVEDVTLIQLFAEKQDELDRQLTALKNIDLPTFYYDSVQLYGRPDDDLVALANKLLDRVEVRTDHESAASPRSECVQAQEIVVAAREQIDHYHQALPGFVATVHVRNDLASTMMVAQDHLYISESGSLPRHVLQPLLHHEVGTHLLTYFNGRQQPFQQLYAGLAGYEELQEGLAVLAEYLGGGLTKDAIYLRGLRNLLDYLRQGHDLQPLYVGKIALEHIPMIQELRRRGIVVPPAVLPSLLDDAEAAQRLERCRQHTLLELAETIV